MIYELIKDRVKEGAKVGGVWSAIPVRLRTSLSLRDVGGALVDFTSKILTLQDLVA